MRPSAFAPFAMVASIGLLCGLVRAEVPEDLRWADTFHPAGIVGTVWTAAEYGGELVVGGSFAYAGAALANGVARWDGLRWQALGEGLGGAVYSLVPFSGGLAACGSFAPPLAPSPSVAFWDGARWLAMGDGLSAGRRELAVHQGSLYCGGYLWTGSEWQNVLQTDARVEALEVWNGLLVAAGGFTTAAGVQVDHALTWDGEAVHPMPLPGDRPIRDLQVVGQELYCLLLNDYYRLCPQPIQQWDGNAWRPVANPFPESWWIPTLGMHGGQLACVAAGRDLIHPYRWQCVCRWDGTDWFDILSEQFWTEFNVVQPFAGGTLLAGAFDYLVKGELTVASSVALLREGTLEAFEGDAGGLTGPVLTLVTTPEGLAAGGSFATAGSVPASTVAVWDGSGWFSRGFSGPPGPSSCSSLDWAADRLYGVMQFFTDIDESWWWWWDGSLRVWDPRGGGCAYPPDRCLNRIHVWRGRILGCDQCSCSHGIHDLFLSYFFWPWFLAEADAPVTALQTWRGDLVATGEFTTIDGVPAEHVAAFDSVSWRQLGEGLPGKGEAIAVEGERLAVAYVVGGARRVAVWQGEAWVDLDGLFDNAVNGLCWLDRSLYAGGAFAHVDGMGAAHVARWDGQAWHPLGSGTDGIVHAVAPYEGRLYVGGDFKHAGGKPSFNIAAWQPEVVGVALERFDAERDGAAVALSWRLAPGLEGDLRLGRVAGGPPELALATLPIAGRTEFAWLDPDPPASSALTYVLTLRRPGAAPDELGRVEVAPASGPPAPPLALAAPRPNPTNPGTEIRFSFGRPGPVRLTVHDARGRLVAVLVDEPRAAGEHVLRWDGTDRAGRRLPAGSYLLRLQADRRVESRKITLLP